MQVTKRFGGAAAALAIAFTMAAAPASARVYNSDQTALLADSVAAVDHMRSDESFGPSRDLLRQAKAVLIVPKLVKAGFIFGGEGGDGVLLERHGHSWSQPVFYTLGSASFGFQIGLEQAQLVMFVMSNKALRAVERSKFKFGGGAGLTVATVGANAEGATSGNLTGDIIVWASSKGLYGGLTLNGSVLTAKDDWNAAFYGREVSVRDVLSNRVSNPRSARLRQALVRTH
jgi:lipid-binding SYLF domain-containing protein